jgi:hypothetical protein
MQAKLIRTGIVVAAVLCTGITNLQAQVTYDLPCLASGNWNTANQRQDDNYQIGFSTEQPIEQAAYFLYDLTPVQGQTIVTANMLIIGSTDYHISTFWPNHQGSPPQVWFKVGIVPQTVSRNSVDEIVNGDNIPGLYTGQIGSNANDNGYAWVMDGLHEGVRFDAWHYEGTGHRPPRLQDAVNAGGLFVMWAADRFDNANDGENYIWGSTAFDAGNQLRIVTRN